MRRSQPDMNKPVALAALVHALSMEMARFGEQAPLPPDLVITVSSGDETVVMSFMDARQTSADSN